MDELAGSHRSGDDHGGARPPAIVIPGYEITAMLGRGAFGVVYRAWQPAFHRDVAIKVLMDALDQRDAARLLRECQALGTASSHPNIVTVHEAGFTADGRGFLVMEYLGKGSLADQVGRDGALAWPDVARTGVRLAGALETAHRASVLHRDIKPDNILLSDYGEPKLADFGIARLVGGTATRTGPVYASILYAAPEVLAGQGSSTAASDVYALGGTLLTLLTGHPPFVPGPDEPVAAFIARIVSTPPDLVVDGAPAGLMAVIGRALAKDPSARQATAEELGEALRNVQVEAGGAVTDMLIGVPTAAEVRPQPADAAPVNRVPWLHPPVPVEAPAPRPGPVAASASAVGRTPMGTGTKVIIAVAVVVAMTILAAIGSHDRSVESSNRNRAEASFTTAPSDGASAPSTAPPTSAPLPTLVSRKIAAVPAAARCAASMSYGQTVACALGGAGDVRRVDFTGAAGDHVFARAVRLAGDFALVPSPTIVGPDGAPACSETRDCTLKAAGRHSIVVQDMSKQAVGEYAVYLQRTNNPAGCGDIAIGEGAEGTLEPPGAMACAIFTAAAGDRVVINAVGTERGTPVFGEVGIMPAGGGGSACPVQQDCLLARGGRYIVLASSSILGAVGQTGPYRITVTCLAGPCRSR